MFNPKILKFSTTLIILFTILSRHGVVTERSNNYLYICGNDSDPNIIDSNTCSLIGMIPSISNANYNYYSNTNRMKRKNNYIVNNNNDINKKTEEGVEEEDDKGANEEAEEGVEEEDGKGANEEAEEGVEEEDDKGANEEAEEGVEEEDGKGANEEAEEGVEEEDDKGANEQVEEEVVEGDGKGADEELDEENTNSNDIVIECNVLNGKNCEETYYLVNSRYEVIDNGVGDLYHCKEDNYDMKCTQIFTIGYYIVSGSLGYYCGKNDNNISCSKLGNRIKTDVTTCSDVGDIIYDNSSNKLFFCQASGTATTNAIELNLGNSGNYAIPKSTAMDIFGLTVGQYALVNIKDKVITLNSTYTNNLKYVYVNLSTKNRILEEGDTCPMTTGASPTWDYEQILELKDCNNGKCNLNLSA